ncbi:MAG: hypothetical protein GF309_13225 [Candidatus Lokiarchaeota archaeon]|nr:hypothetical protein [Candidatus Lokiarchaeota archaeon]
MKPEAEIQHLKNYDFKFFKDYQDQFNSFIRETNERFGPKMVEKGVESAEKVAKYVFRVFRHYMNKIIRYYKYERMHHWLNEIKNSDAGYFFVINKVEHNGNEIVPYSHHNIVMSMLTKDYVYMDEKA